MKKITLLLLLVLFPLVAQDTDETQSECVATGIILKIEGTRINFDEAWLTIGGYGAKRMPVIITDTNNNTLNYSNFTAPCLVELTHTYQDDEIVPVRIKILEQYHFDANGDIVDSMD